MSIQSRIKSLGGLHDARVTSLAWHPDDRTLLMVVDDINANTNGLPEYPGKTEATLVFSEVTLLHIEADLACDGLLIFDWIISRKEPDGYSSSVVLSPGGRLAIECRKIAVQPA